MTAEGEAQQAKEEQQNPSTNTALQTRSNSTRPQHSYCPSQRSNISSTSKTSHGIHRPNRPTLSPVPQSQSQSRAQSSQQPLQRPHYSLAGNFTAQAHAPSYVDPKYYELNPRYQKPENSPVWGLSKPLPRVVRPGMRRKSERRDDGKPEAHGVVENKDAEVAEPGSAEAIPQVGMINEQRQKAGKERVSNREKNTEERGYGNQKAERRRDDTIAKMRSGSSAGHDTTPMDERGNPMEEWLAKQPSKSPNPFDDRNGDKTEPGMRRLTSVQESPSRAVSTLTTVSRDFAEGAGDQDVDLEAGDRYDDEWSLEKEEAQQYEQEEWEMHNGWASFRARFREPLAECLATTIAITIGLCTNLAVQTSNNTSGNYPSQNWGWGLGVTIGIYIAGGISGAHLNPVISLTLCLYRGFPFRKALVYIAAQLLGGFLAALIAYGIYRDAILSYDMRGGDIGAKGGSSAPVGLFAGGTGKALFTGPADFAGVGASFGNEFVATAILSCAVLALGDDSNAPPGAGMHAFIVGLVVFVLTMAFGYTTGPCLNPARDLGPRVVAAMVGYGGRVFTNWNAWWIYGAWGATISGGLVGGLMYDAIIFVGGESPVNYPRGKRRRAEERVKKKWFGVTGRLKGAVRKEG